MRENVKTNHCGNQSVRNLRPKIWGFVMQKIKKSNFLNSED